MENSELTFKKGYKQTEVGIIPEDWESALLNEVCERISVGLATSVTKYYRKSGVPIVRNLNIKDGYFDGSDMLYLSEDFAKANFSKAAKALDVLTVHTGSNLGLTCVLPPEFHNCQTFTTLITTPKRNKLNPYFLSFFMGSFFGEREMRRLEVGGGKGNLNTGDLKQYKVVIPPLPEQQAIAEVLSDVDALITSLDQLITKKRNIKQGTMQLLLTGKKRLVAEIKKGYKQTDVGIIPEDWEMKSIIKCAEYVDYRGKTPNKTENGRFLVTAKNIREGFIDYENSKEYIAEDDYERTMSRGKPKIGDVLITTEAPLGNVAAIDREDIALAQRVIKYRAKKEYLNSDYLKYYFLGSKFQKILDDNSSGSTAQGIKGSVLHKLPVILPPIEEQKAIARILSEMDAEIEALEIRRDKYKAVKQGMMQELLTGKTRLI